MAFLPCRAQSSRQLAILASKSGEKVFWNLCSRVRDQDTKKEAEIQEFDIMKICDPATLWPLLSRSSSGLYCRNIKTYSLALLNLTHFYQILLQRLYFSSDVWGREASSANRRSQYLKVQICKLFCFEVTWDQLKPNTTSAPFETLHRIVWKTWICHKLTQIFKFEFKNTINFREIQNPGFKWCYHPHYLISRPIRSSNIWN